MANRQLLQPRKTTQELLPWKQAYLAGWVKRRLGSVAHEQRVTRVALALFDLTVDLHSLGKPERRILEMAAMAHDVGRSIDDDGHEKHGAAMVMEEDALPLGETERRRVAFLVRYHKGRLADRGDEQFLADADDRDALRILLALLRAADALDSRWLEGPRLIMSLRGRCLHILGYVARDLDRARRIYGKKRKKFRVLEDELGLETEIEWRRSEALRLVA